MVLISMAFKSYCWSIGTTSFRTKNFIYSIEKQLELLDEFWKINPDTMWTGNYDVQTAYYEFLKTNKFITGEAKDKAKDARQKISGLFDIGLLDSSRKITEVGYKILEITRNNDYNNDNILNVPNDSFVYFLQLIKMQFVRDGFKVKPYIFIIYLLEKLGYLTDEEFAYLLPMCRNKTELVELSKKLLCNRKNFDYDKFIVDKLMSMNNYQEELQYFMNCDNVDESTFEKIGMNRDGGHHDRSYYAVYNSLYKLYLSREKKYEDRKMLYSELWNAIQNISNTVCGRWKKYLFMGIKKINKIDSEFDKNFKFLDISLCEDEKSFKEKFFEMMHLYKCKATLDDYSDLNKRYLSLSETLRFKDGIIELEILPKYFFKDIIELLIDDDFVDIKEYHKMMKSYLSLSEISPLYDVDKELLLKKINSEFNTNLEFGQLKTYIGDIKMKEFAKIIDEKFTDEYLIKILSNIENRNDNYVMNEISNNADIPTIFEYILGIVWYKISNKKGDLLDFMHLSLDNNLLPKTHAGGGIADIEYKYNSLDGYVDHTLLIEVTLSDSTNQRSMEMEPVSRHLGESIRVDNNYNNYALFVAPRLDERLILDFRNMKTRLYPFSKNHSVINLEKIDNEDCSYIHGLKIIPITVGIIKKILCEHYSYKDLYEIFDNAYKSLIPDELWYNEEIVQKFL